MEKKQQNPKKINELLMLINQKNDHNYIEHL